MDLNPLIYLLVQGLLATVTIQCTNTRSSVRAFSLVVILWAAYWEFCAVVKNNDSNGFTNGLVAASSVLYTAQLANILWINGLDAEDLKAPSNSPRDSFVQILRLVGFNFRGIGTRWETKNIPPFSTYYHKRAPRSRIRFLTRQIAVMAYQYLLIDAFASQLSKISQADKNRLVGPNLEFTYISATREQWLCRIVSSIVVWWVVDRCFLTFLYNFVSVLGVSTGMFSVEDFPPFMGSMWSGYTLRGYWGKFWHQTLRWPLTTLSTCITKNVLHLSKPSLLERYMHIFLVYTLSGVLHVFIDVGDGKTEFAGTMAFFQSFAVGIMIEDGVQALWRKYTGEEFKHLDEDVTLWKKIVGFIWVCSFFSIVSPWYLYPGARLPFEKTLQLPITLTELIGERGTAMAITSLGLTLLFIFKAEI